jgi:tetratricopeptide (TPR) repeat protein
MKLNFFVFSPPVKKLIIIMSFVFTAGIVISYFYYGRINSAEDPRIVHIKEMHKTYDRIVRDNEIGNAVALLDSMDMEFAKIRHYSDSFERGVINTDIAAAHINSALYLTTDEDTKLSFLEKAEERLRLSLGYYDRWKMEYSVLDSASLYNKISDEFSDINSAHIERIVDKRMSDIRNALSESGRRYSVTYTNLGIIMRHKLNQDSAALLYKKALELWDDNHIARSNLNVLLGGKPVKKGILETVFPTEKK